jgi:hypothetical protein
VLRAIGARQRVLNGPLEYAPSEIEDPDAPPAPRPAPGPAPAPAPVDEKKGGG